MQSQHRAHQTRRAIGGNGAAPQPAAQSVRAGAGARLLGIGESTFWRWAKQREDFPAPRRLGPRTTVFDAGELIAWRDAQASIRK
jgi:prophage regulatory protein